MLCCTNDINLKETSRSDRASLNTFEMHTENKTWRVFKEVLSYIIFPIKLVQVAHLLFGYKVVPARKNPDHIPILQEEFSKKSDTSELKKIILKVDGYSVEAFLVIRNQNNRWMLHSHGNAGFCEDYIDLEKDSFMKKPFLEEIITHADTNVVFFNYPGIGNSTGFFSKKAMVKAYSATLRYLEEEQKAEEIICYGHSIGAGIQSEALKRHDFKEDINYAFVKHKSFSKISLVPYYDGRNWAKISSFFLKLFGWEISSKEVSRNLQELGYPEIIIQQAEKNAELDHHKITDFEQLKDNDDAIPKDASLAKVFLETQEEFNHKFLFGAKSSHNELQVEEGVFLGNFLRKIFEENYSNLEEIDLTTIAFSKEEYFQEAV